MRISFFLLAGAGAAARVAASVYELSASVPAGAGAPLLDAFVSYSIELASFPDFSGNTSAPNVFSNALLGNLGVLTGAKPYIRVGGNTQAYILYNASLARAINGTSNLSRSADYPTTVYIGPSFFEGYGALPGVRFSHGFNLALAPTPAGWQTLLDTVLLVCKALAPWGDEGRSSGETTRRLSHRQHWLYTLEYGNEPDLLSTSAHGPTRGPRWNENTYVVQWLNGTRQIQRLKQKYCPELLLETTGLSQQPLADVSVAAAASILPDYAGFMAPSFAGVNNHLKASTAWKDGIDIDTDIALFSSHKNYISGATSPGVTLQGTLMNHSRTVLSVDAHVDEYTRIFGTTRSAPRHIMGEANSLYNEGKPGLSNVFGTALWSADFLLYCAAAGLGRVHMHQGTNYRYASWQPIDTDKATRGTKPPYYGNVAAAASLGDTSRHSVSVAALSPATSDVDSVYAVYSDGRLVRVLVLNLRGYNTTLNGTGLGQVAPDSISPRPSHIYTLTVPTTYAESSGTLDKGRNQTRLGILVQRLLANGSDAISGITWDGWSFNVELDGGKPVRLSNVTTGEQLPMQNGQVTIGVPDSSAALLHF